MYDDDDVDRPALVRLITDVADRARRDGTDLAGDLADALGIIAARGGTAPTVTAGQRNAAVQAMLTAAANPPGPGYDVTAWAMGATDSVLAALGIEVR